MIVNLNGFKFININNSYNLLYLKLLMIINITLKNMFDWLKCMEIFYEKNLQTYLDYIFYRIKKIKLLLFIFIY